MSCVDAADLAAFLAEHPPFDSLGAETLDAMARGSRVERFARSLRSKRREAGIDLAEKINFNAEVEVK